MTSLITERFGAASSTREIRMADFARRRAVDELAGRTIWFAAALREGRARARRLRELLRWARDGGVAIRELPVAGASELREVSAGGEALLGAEVRAGDLVVLHDAMTAPLVEVVRERGAHAVLHVHPHRLVRPATDAYLVTWREVAPGGRVADEIAALMPSPDLVTAKEIGERADRDLAWGCLIADVAHDARGDRVGGTRHARPVVVAH